MKPYLSGIIAVALAAVIAMSTLAGCRQSQPSDIGAITPIETPPPTSAEAPAPSVPVQEGERAPDFRLVKAGGGEVSLSDYRGKILVLDFWATNCGACVAELPAYQALYDRWDHNQVEYLGLSLDSSIKVVEGFLQRKGFTLPMALLDEQTRVAYLGQGVVQIPQARVIDASGVVAAVLPPAQSSPEKVAAVVEQLLARSG